MHLNFTLKPTFINIFKHKLLYIATKFIKKIRKLDSTEAAYGFNSQIKGVDEKGKEISTRKFWGQTFDTLKAYLPMWIHEKGPQLDIITVSD